MHDMLHLAVEAAFGFTDGLWASSPPGTRPAAGELPDRLDDAAIPCATTEAVRELHHGV